jgi:hypothetical protein
VTTPKTEAGREYLDAHRADLHSPGDLPDGPCWCLDSILAIEQEAGRLAVAEALSVERVYAALDGVLPHMAFERYGQFYNDDPWPPNQRTARMDARLPRQDRRERRVIVQLGPAPCKQCRALVYWATFGVIRRTAAWRDANGRIHHCEPSDDR